MYKREGDGNQCDGICEDVYAFYFYFHHRDAPPLLDHMKDMKLLPTAKQVVCLMDHLPNFWTHIYMDNLFNSRKLFTAAYRVKCLCHGVTRTNGRGLPAGIIQKVETDPKAADRLRGTTKAAVLRNVTECPNLIACSVYDTKPVHMLSTVAETIEWEEKKRRVWSYELKRHVQMGYLRLNLIDMYNNNMNSVDIADQHRNCYRFNHWLRNRKWWWAIFMWSLGIAATNGYLLYEKTFEEAKKTKKDMPKKWNHLQFLCELIYDFLDWKSGEEEERECSNLLPVSGRTRSGGSVAASTASYSVDATDKGKRYDFNTVEGREAFFDDVHPTTITENRMNNSFFMIRLDGRFHPSIPTCTKSAYCQYCKFKYTHKLVPSVQKKNEWMFNNRGGIKQCLECNVNYCPDCVLFVLPIGMGYLGTR